jgi:2,3-bisphosphoglycerate-dependent phosphoglycerate mutase
VDPPLEYSPRRCLVLTRHGQRRANADGHFTGKLDSPLTDIGRHEATAAGRRLKDEGFRFDASFTSTMVRAIETSRLALEALGQSDLAPCRDAALDECDYDVLSGLDKRTAYRRFGEKRVEHWRCSYTGLPPDGESLRDTVARMTPFYLDRIRPAATLGPTFVVGYGNALRGLVMRLEGMDARQVEALELATGSIRAYALGSGATVVERRTYDPAST